VVALRILLVVPLAAATTFLPITGAGASEALYVALTAHPTAVGGTLVRAPPRQALDAGFRIRYPSWASSVGLGYTSFQLAMDSK
jgi:hypothetical protein